MGFIHALIVTTSLAFTMPALAADFFVRPEPMPAPVVPAPLPSITPLVDPPMIHVDPPAGVVQDCHLECNDDCFRREGRPSKCPDKCVQRMCENRH